MRELGTEATAQRPSQTEERSQATEEPSLCQEANYQFHQVVIQEVLGLLSSPLVTRVIPEPLSCLEVILVIQEQSSFLLVVILVMAGLLLY